MDKDKFLSHLNREQDRQLGGRILDLIEIIKERKKEKSTDFLNPYQRKLSRKIIKQVNEINFLEDGGYKEAERKRIVIFPDFLFPDHVQAPVTLLEVKGNFNFNSVNHQDFLGAIMGLGLKRKKIGDILVLDGRAQVVAATEIKQVIMRRLKKVHQVPVEVTEISRNQVEIPTQKSKDILATVASMRLDAVASAGFGDSRSKISRDIENGKVKLNWKPEDDPAADVGIGDIISFRHRGRVEVSRDRGVSNRGRKKLLLKRFT